MTICSDWVANVSYFNLFVTRRLVWSAFLKTVRTVYLELILALVLVLELGARVTGEG